MRQHHNPKSSNATRVCPCSKKKEIKKALKSRVYNEKKTKEEKKHEAV